MSRRRHSLSHFDPAIEFRSLLPKMPSRPGSAWELMRGISAVTWGQFGEHFPW